MDPTPPRGRLRRLLDALGPLSPVATLATYTPASRLLLVEAERSAEVALKAREEAVLERYVPTGLTRELERSGSPDDGGRQTELTLLIADIRGFSRMAERLTPVGAVALLNQFFAVVEVPLAAEGAVLDKYLGDGFLAFFVRVTPGAACAPVAVHYLLTPDDDLALTCLPGTRATVPSPRIGRAKGSRTPGRSYRCRSCCRPRRRRHPATHCWPSPVHADDDSQSSRAMMSVPLLAR